jgi:HlyD family secretion protein
MKNNRILIIIVAVLLVAVIGGVIAKKQGWIGGSGARQVAAEKAQARSIVETVTASGKIHSETEVKIVLRYQERFILLKVKEGDSVRKGDLLLEYRYL